MRLRILLATCAMAGLIAVPGLASADWYDDCCCMYGYDFGSRWHAYGDANRYMSYDSYGYPIAVAGYSSMNLHPSMKARDNARIAEYRSIFGTSPRVAGYTATGFQPWLDGGTWATVNGQHIWVTPRDFAWSNNRWVWSDSPNAMIVFDDPRYQVTTRDWTSPSFRTTTSLGPWVDGGTWVTVNGQRIWATPDDFVWMNNRWVWADNNTAVIDFDDDRFDINSRDWGVSIDSDRFDVDSDRFDVDVDRDRFDVDPDRFNIDEDRLQIETDVD